MNLLLGALAEGFILAPLALGLYLSYRVYEILDLTADGSFAVGAAVVAALLVRGVAPTPATLLGALAGVLAGVSTGILYTRFGVHASLAGILVATSLYSAILLIMGGGMLSLAPTKSLATMAEAIARRIFSGPAVTLPGSSVGGESLVTVVLSGLVVSALAIGLTLFLRTDLGLAMRAAGGNSGMARSVAVDVDRMIVLGLGLSNGLIALSGALLAQFQGYSSVQMITGAVVTGLAMLLIGEALLGRRPLGRWVAGAAAGAVIFRLLIAGAIRAGLNPNALKLVTALLVLLVLVLPRLAVLARRVGVSARVPRHV